MAPAPGRCSSFFPADVKDYTAATVPLYEYQEEGGNGRFYSVDAPEPEWTVALEVQGARPCLAEPGAATAMVRTFSADRSPLPRNKALPAPRTSRSGRRGRNAMSSPASDSDESPAAGRVVRRTRSDR